jgi:hypothetical protein
MKNQCILNRFLIIDRSICCVSSPFVQNEVEAEERIVSAEAQGVREAQVHTQLLECPFGLPRWD